jgi:hypothetical protein
MNPYARVDFRRDAGVVGGMRIARRMKIAVMMAAIVSIVALLLISESRLTPEQRLELFESSHAYP